MNQLALHLASMKHSPRHNYVIPGLTSWLVGGVDLSKGTGIVRLFTCSRDHEEPILPHTHRFNFTCVVLYGKVRNRIWWESSSGDEYMESSVTYEGIMGQHKKTECRIDRFTFTEHEYAADEEYSMKAGEFHSIYFSKGAQVLFFEGPSDPKMLSYVLEPVVDGEVIPLFRTDPWMFRAG